MRIISSNKEESAAEIFNKNNYKINICHITCSNNNWRASNLFLIPIALHAYFMIHISPKIYKPFKKEALRLYDNIVDY